MGILAAVAVRKGVGSRWWFLAALASLALWLNLGADRALSPMVGLAFAFAIPPTVELERQSAFAVPSWLLLFGAASYALYLTHGLTISVVARLAASQAAILTLGTLASIAGGVGYYWIVEKPMLKWAGKRSARLANPQAKLSP